MDESKVIPYGQHYRCFPQMIGSVVNQSVFMYIMDEYAQRLRNNSQLYFQIKVNEIANDRNMTWRSVTNSLQSLQDMKLISMNDNVCVVDGDRFVSLIHAFSNVGGKAARKEFSKILEAGDYDSLVKFGYVYQESSREELLKLKGGIEQGDGYAKWQSPLLNGTTSAKKQNLCQMTQPLSFDIAKPLLNDTTSAKKQNLMLKSRGYFIEMVNSIKSDYEKTDFIKQYQELFLEFLSEEELNSMIDSIFDENGVENVTFGPEWFCFLAEGVMLNSRGRFCHLAEGVLPFSRTVNKYININKENTEEDVLSGKNQSSFFDSSSTPSNLDNSQDNQEEFADLNFCREITAGINSFHNQTSSYQNLKHKSRLPFFSVEEIQKIISDLTYCLDHPDKIFINQVWDHLLPFFVFETEGEREGVTEKQQDPEGMIFYADRIIQDVISPAFERTQEIISQGKVIIKGEEHPVSCQELRPEDIESIVDFQITNKDGEQVYIISKKKFKNIRENEIPVAAKKNLREGRENDKRYMQEIILLGDDDEHYSELTPIELAIYNFLSENFNISDDGSIDEPKQRFINRIALGRFYISMIEKGLTEKDFLDVLFKNRPDRQDGSLQLKSRMFDSNKIKEWNAFRSHISVISNQGI